MIIRSVRLRNIRSYQDALIEFPTGTILLAGDIGSGKSTVLLAIEFALFGIRRTELPGSSLLRHDATKGEVELNFTIEGKDVSIRRTLKRQAGNVVQDAGHIIIGGVKIEGTPVELKSKVLEILGYPDDLLTKSKSLIYRYTAYTPQEELKQILAEDRETRLNTLRSVFGIDRYKTMRENAAIYNRELKRKKAELLGIVSDFDEKVDQAKSRRLKIDEIDSEMKDLAPRLSEARAKVEAGQESLRKIEEALEKVKEYRKRIEMLKERAEDRKISMRSLENNLGISIRKAEDSRKRLHKYAGIDSPTDPMVVEQRLKAFENEHIQKTKDFENASARIHGHKERIELLDKEIEEMSQDSRQAILLSHRISQIDEEIRSLLEADDKLVAIQEKAADLESGIMKSRLLIEQSRKTAASMRDLDVCPVCRQKVDESHKHDVSKKEKALEEMESGKIASLQKQKEEAATLIRKLQAEQKERRDKEKQKVELSEKLSNLERQASRLVEKQRLKTRLIEEMEVAEKGIDGLTRQRLEQEREALERLKTELRLVTERNMLYREKVNLLEQIGDEEKRAQGLKDEIEAGKRALEEIEAKAAELSTKVSKFDSLDERYKVMKEDLEAHKREEKGLDIRMAELRQDRKSQEDILKQLEGEIRQKEEVKERITYLSDLQNWVEKFFIGLMTQMEKQVLLSVYHEFNRLLKEWFSLLIDDIDIRLDEEFTPVLIQDGYETEIGSLSGGEKTSVALAYRLALNQVINRLIRTIKTRDFLILDEPTDGFSSEMLDKVRDLLYELDVKQIIIVSHEPKLESMVDNIIRIQKTDHASQIMG